MENQPQNPEFMVNLESFHPWFTEFKQTRLQKFKYFS